MKAKLRLLTLAAALLSASAWGQDAKVLWVHRFHPQPNNSRGGLIAVDQSGNVVLTANAPFVGDGAYYVAKYATDDGRVLWERRYTSPGGEGDSADYIAVDGAGDVIVTGTFYPPNNTDSPKLQLHTAKFAAANGKLLWENRYQNPLSRVTYPNGLAVDAAGNVVVTSTSSYRIDYVTNDDGDSYINTYYDIYTAKYAAPDGRLLWERRFHKPLRQSYGEGGAMDSQGNMIVAGSSFSFNTRISYDHLFKYGAERGVTQWQRRRPPPDKKASSESQAIAVDPAGNVAVTGWYYHYDGDRSEYYTAKYASADGALLWEKHLRPGNTYLLATDSVGNVIVSGYNIKGAQASIKYIPFLNKYAAADGALVWERENTYPESVNNIAVDAEGNVVVIGSYYDGRVHWVTAKYAAADGAALWKKDFDAQTGHDEFARAQAVGPGFVVVTGTLSLTGNEFGPSDYATVKYVDGPTPETVSAQVFSATIAYLFGAVNPNGFATTGAFEYSLDPALTGASTTESVFIGLRTTAVRTDATLTGLEPNRTYYYRAIATGNTNTTRGAIRSFTTPRQENDLHR